MRFWKYATFFRVEPWHALLGRRRTLALECITWCRDLRGILIENIPLPRVLLEECILPSQGQKTLQAPAKGLSSAGDRGTPRENITFAAFSGATNRFHTLHRPETVFQGQKTLDTEWRGTTPG